MSSSAPTIKLPEGAHLDDDGRPSVSSVGGTSHIHTTPPIERPQTPTTALGTSGVKDTSRKIPAKFARKETSGKDAKEVIGGSSLYSSTPPPIDPLSQHILKRTNTDKSLSRLRPFGRPDSPSTPANEGPAPPTSEPSSSQVTTQADLAKEKRKSSSFLSRFSMKGNKKKGDDTEDDDSSLSELRTEGANAVAFSAGTFGAAGYIPHHKEPPRYIRVRSQNKKIKEFNRMFLAQELLGTRPPSKDSEKKGVDSSAKGTKVPVAGRLKTGGAIWAVEFSQDGKYLATAGRDGVVRIWAVISTPEDRTVYEETNVNRFTGERLSAPVFQPNPDREFTGHTGDILDLSWSKNNFLLSSSMDKTVRLWHVSRQECLCAFKHPDFVTSIAFHPTDDRFFLAGSLDSTARLWSIPDKDVAYTSELPDLITAVAFSPDGRYSIVGCLNGVCTFYETEGLKQLEQIHVRSSRGKNAKGSKITGIHTMTFGQQPDVKVLITSNDSRIRVYNLRTKTLETKFKGHENACNQIRASFSDDGSYIICGSEDCKAYIWSTATNKADNADNKRAYEYFEAHPAIVTQAVFAPTSTRRLLQASLDPIYTLCNPPPIVLQSKEETAGSHTSLPREDSSQTGGRSRATSIRKPEQSPAFLARSAHRDGNIIITTDYEGWIKVFRQDCAFTKRRHDNWETGSSFSRKVGRDGVLLGRSSSVATRASGGSGRNPRSRRSSISQPPQQSSDRILSWRQEIEGSTKQRPMSIALGSVPGRSERSNSPVKPQSSDTNLTSETRPSSVLKPSPGRLQSPQAIQSPQIQITESPKSPPAVRNPPLSIKPPERDIEREASQPASPPISPPIPSFSFRSIDEQTDGATDGSKRDSTGSGYSFWNLSRWRSVRVPLAASRAFISKPRSSESRGSGPKSDTPTIQEEQTAEAGDDAQTNPSTPAADDSSRTDSPPPKSDRVERRRSTMGYEHLRSIGNGEHLTSRADRRKSTMVYDHLAFNGNGSGNGDHLLPTMSSLPSLDRQGSTITAISMLTSELTSEGPSDEGEGEDMQCSKCGSRQFKARKVGGKQRFLCSRCGRMADG